MIRCVIVDDEPLALELIKSYVEKTSFLELAGSFLRASDAMNMLQQEPVDLLFLDIQMPDITGIEAASSIDTFRTKVVFITAFDNFALDGFRVNAVDYLLKPIGYPDFFRSAIKVRKLIENSADSQIKGSLVVRADYRLIKIKYQEILYLESVRDYVMIYLENGTFVKTHTTLKGIEHSLPLPPFLRVHRSFIVNLERIKVLERNCILFGKQRVPVSEAYKEELMQKLNIM